MLAEPELREPGVSTNGLGVRDLTVTYRGIVALDQVSLFAEAGHVTALIGPNGAGKTTLLGAVSGFVRVKSGDVFVRGERLTNRSQRMFALAGVRRTFQRAAVVPDLNVFDHLVLGNRAANYDHRVWLDALVPGKWRSPARDNEVDAKVGELLDRLGLSWCADRLAATLPPATQRIVELGMALAADPFVLLLDEPTAGLDRSETDEIAEVLRKVVEETGIVMVVVEHDVSMVMSLCDPLYVLNFGHLIAAGKPQDVRNNPVVQDAYLGGKAEVDRQTFAGNGSGSTSTGETLEGAASAQRSPTSLVVSHLSVAYGGLEVVSDVSFEASDADVLTILGRNGAGKTTIARTLAGLNEPRSGTVEFCGRSLAGLSSWDVARLGLAFVPEASGVFPSLTVTENLRMWFRRNGRRGQSSRQIDAAFELFPALAARRRQAAGNLSGGEQRMLALSRVLVERAPLVVVDEPSLGLAPILIDEVYRVLAMARDNGTTLVIIEQFVERALAIATKVLILDRGRTAWSGPADRIPDERLREAYLGASDRAPSDDHQGGEVRL